MHRTQDFDAPASGGRMTGAVPADTARLGSGHAGGAGAAALRRPPKDDAPVLPGCGGVEREQGTGNDGDSADASDERKSFEKLRARGALVGCGLYELASGGFVLTRWSLVRELPSLRAVDQLLSAMGVRK